MARESRINFLLATKIFISFIFHNVIFNVVIEPKPNLCVMNRAFIFKKRIIKNSLKNIDNISLSTFVFLPDDSAANIALYGTYRIQCL